jgi:hypothetical protein
MITHFEAEIASFEYKSLIRGVVAYSRRNRSSGEDEAPLLIPTFLHEKNGRQNHHYQNYNC